MKRPYGMAQRAFDAYFAAMKAAGINPDRIVQTIGNAPASHGFHTADGVDEFGHGYCAAVDLSVKHPGALTDDEIQTVLDELAQRGFIGWFRDWGVNSHIHVVFCALKMKVQLRDQVHDWFQHRDGLADHGFDDYFMPTVDEDNTCRADFLAYNPPSG